MATPTGESIDDAGGATPGAASPSDPTGAKVGKDPTARSVKVRRRFVNVLAVLTCFALLVSAVAIWSHRLLLNTDAWVATVGPLADNPAITDAVAAALTEEIFQLVKPEDLAKRALPDKADFLAAPMATAVEDFVLKQSKELLKTDQFQEFWIKANTLVHENAVALLRGETVAGFTAKDGVVTINLLPLLSKTMIWITDKAPGIFGAIVIPTITAETPPDQARAELSKVLRVTVPPTFGVYTVLKDDQLGAAQRAIQLFDRLVILILVVTLGLLIATIALSRNRRRTLIFLGVGTVLAMVLANALTQATERLILDLIGKQQARAAAEATISKLILDLRLITNTLFWAGIAVVVVAFLSGDSRIATGIRDGVSRTVGRATGGDPTVGGALATITHYAGPLKILGVAAAVVALVAIDATLASLAVVLVILGLYELFIALVTGSNPVSDPSPELPAIPDDSAATPTRV